MEHEDYFNTYPKVSEKLPPEMRDFGPYLMNLRMPQHDLRGILILAASQRIQVVSYRRSDAATVEAGSGLNCTIRLSGDSTALAA